MSPARRGHCVSLLVALLILPQASTAFDTPLSETAVRDAYFLGQRHDDSLGQLLSKHSRYFQQPETGPYIQSVSFFTPYVLVALNSSQQAGTYSAQQAQIDHDKNPEVVRVVVQILLTDSYGPYVVRPTGSGANSPKGLAPLIFGAISVSAPCKKANWSSLGVPKASLACTARNTVAFLRVQRSPSNIRPILSKRTPPSSRSIHPKVHRFRPNSI